MTTKFEEWAILEVMGHNRFAGRVSEQALGGASFVRIDVPAVDEMPGFSKLFSAGSIYCITPVTEDVAVSVARSIKHAPLTVWDLPDEIKQKIRTAERLEHSRVPAEPYDVVADDEPDDFAG